MRGSFEKEARDSNARRADQVSGRVASRRVVPRRVPCAVCGFDNALAGVNLKMAESRDSAVAVSSATTGAVSEQQPAVPESTAQGDEDPSGRTTGT